MWMHDVTCTPTPQVTFTAVSEDDIMIPSKFCDPYRCAGTYIHVVLRRKSLVEMLCCWPGSW